MRNALLKSARDYSSNGRDRITTVVSSLNENELTSTMFMLGISRSYSIPSKEPSPQSESSSRCKRTWTLDGFGGLRLPVDHGRRCEPLTSEGNRFWCDIGGS